ncbi:MAG: hypothetical protein WC710_15380 [Gallionella sp.]|jgi:hypothetical protein
MTDTLTKTAGLAALLEARLMDWEEARKPQEVKLLECYQDVMRIAREDDTKGSGAARSKKAAGLFIGSTRNKVRAARAKINDALFGNGEMPFDTNPTNEDLAKYADVVEDIVTEQLEKMGYRGLLKTGVNTLATYGTGFTFGPFVKKETITETEADNSLGYTQLIENKYEYDCPYFELGNTLDVYPDPEARTVEDGLGVFWVTMESRHTVSAWKSDKSYSNIAESLIGASDNGNETGSEMAQQMRGNVEYWHKNNRIKVARFFGKVPKHTMQDGNPTEGDPDPGEMVDAVVIMAGGVVVKQSESPYGHAPVQHCTYEDVPHEIWGVGPAENNAPHQKTVNAAFRLFMEGKGMALLGTKSVDRSMFMPTEDFKKFPGKVYQFKPNLSPDERNSAIIDHQERDVTDGWIDVIKMSEQFSDDDTGITKYTQGDDSSNLNKTATGISMIMSASSLPIKEVIQNIDENWIEKHVESLIDWDLKYLEVETVEKIHGKEKAQLWGEIKQFGKSSFMEWQATGTSSFMQKEVLTNKLRAFADFAMGNQMTAPLVDARELLQQTWDVMEIGRESPILKDEDGGKPNPQMEQLSQQVKQLDEVIQKMTEELESKDLENKKLAIDEYNAETNRLKVVGPAMDQGQIQQMVMQAITDVMRPYEAPEDREQDEQPEMQEPQQMEQAEPMQEPPQQEIMEPEQPADAGFLTPEDGAYMEDPQ